MVGVCRYFDNHSLKPTVQINEKITVPHVLHAKKTTLKAPVNRRMPHVTSTSKLSPTKRSLSETVTHRAKIMKIATKKRTSVHVPFLISQHPLISLEY